MKKKAQMNENKKKQTVVSRFRRNPFICAREKVRCYQNKHWRTKERPGIYTRYKGGIDKIKKEIKETEIPKGEHENHLI